MNPWIEIESEGPACEEATTDCHNRQHRYIDMSTPFPLVSLLDEILILIFEELRRSAVHSLRSASAVCHRFYSLAVPVLYRDVKLVNRNLDKTSLRLLKDGSRLPSFVRSVTFDDRSINGSNKVLSFFDFLTKAVRLETVEWIGSFNIPQDVLEILHKKFPQLRLTLDINIPREAHGWHEGLGKSLNGLVGFASPLLDTLKLPTFISYQSEKIVSERCLGNIVRGSPNLRELIAYPYVNARPHVPRERHDLGFELEDVLPQPERLCYVSLTLENYLTWGQQSAWERLTVLKVHHTEYLAAFSGRVSCLKSLTIRTDLWDTIDENSSILDMGPLDTLVLVGDVRPRLPIQSLKAYGSTLTKFVWHDLEYRQKGWEQPISLDDIKALNNFCPKLSILSLDIFRDNIWPYDFLQKLSEFSALTSITLHAERRPEVDEAYRKVHRDVGAGATEHLFSHLQKRKLGIPLKDLSLHSVPDGRLSRRRWGIEFQYEDYEPDFTCRISLSDREIVITENNQPRISQREDSELCIKMMSQSQILRPLRNGSKSLFKRWSSISCGRFDGLLWAMKQLDPKFAEKELLKTGILTEKEFSSEDMIEETMSRHLLVLEDILLQNQERREDMLNLIKAELVERKQREKWVEKHGPHCTLFDIIYPSSTA